MTGILQRILSRPRSQSFTPAQLPALAVWFDGTDVATMTVDGSNRIAAWVDKSGNSRQLAEANDSLKPVFDPAAVSGRGVVRFDGTDDKFTFTVEPTLITVGAGWTTAWAGQNTLDQQFRALFGLQQNGASGGPAGYGLAIGFSTLDGYTDLYFGCKNLGAGVDDVAPGHATIPNVNSPHVYVLSYNGSGATTLANYSLRVDGSPVSLSSVPVIAGGLATVGNDGNGFYKGYLMHWVHSASYLTGADQTRLESYLMAQLGI